MASMSCVGIAAFRSTLLSKVTRKLISIENRRTFIEGLCGRVGVLGVPYGKGQKKKGKEEEGLTLAPDAIRSTGFMKDLQELGLDVKDFGNICYQPLGEEVCCENMTNLNHVAAINKELCTNVAKVISECRTCLTLGGDHSLCIGSITGHMSVAGVKDIAVLYVDAHADLNVNNTSPTGNIHGMPMGLIANELIPNWPKNVPGFDWMSPCFSLKNLAYIGLRSVDPWEAHFINKFSIAAFSMAEVQQFGINNVIDMALKHIDPNRNKSIHLSFDIDSLDYAEAPCTTVPVRGGLTLREGLEIVEAVARTKRLGAVDLVEVNPLLGNEYQKEVTLDAAKHILLGMFGHCRKGNPL